MKIKTKLGVAFAAMVVLMAALVGTSVWLMFGAQARTDHITKATAMKIKHVAFAYNRLLRETSGLRSVFMLPDAEAKKKHMQKLVKYRGEWNDAVKGAGEVYAKYGATAKETELLKDIDSGYAGLAKELDKVAQTSIAGDTPEAIKLWDAADKPYRKLQGNLEALVELEYKMSDELAAEGEKAFWTAVKVMGGILGGAVVLALMLGYFLSRSITRPMDRAVELAHRVADGDLTATIESTSRDETGQLLAALQRMNESLQKIVSDVRTGTDAMTGASNEVATGSADLSRRIEQQAANLEEAASSMEALTGTVKQNAANARQANELAASAHEVAAQGGAVVGEVVQTMSSINESSKKISDIIGVIDGIAFQTNILALNAAVEAARAGEQGRGFAVVASEVRTLAQRSAAAAKEIKTLISDSTAKVENGTKLVDQAGKTMDEIVASVKRVTDIIAGISAASDEQSGGIEQVNAAIAQMDQMTQQNAALVEEAAAAAESMKIQAASVAQTMSLFSIAPAAAGVEPEARVERRGPNRAKNVARLPVKPKVEPKRKVEKAVSESNVDSKKTGTDDDWSEF